MKIEWGGVLHITLWVLQGFLALTFLYVGATKFSPRQVFWIALFAKLGLGQWFRYFTGGLEVVCAVLLLIPRMLAPAVALLTCTMAVAVLVHLFVLRDGYASFFPGFLLLVLVVVAFGRWLHPSPMPRF